MKNSVLATLLILAGCRNGGLPPEIVCQSLLSQLAVRILIFGEDYGRLPTNEEGFYYVLTKPYDWPADREWKDFIEPDRPDLLKDPWGNKYGYLLYPESGYGFFVYSVGPGRFYHSLDIEGVPASTLMKLLPESEQRLFAETNKES